MSTTDRLKRAEEYITGLSSREQAELLKHLPKILEEKGSDLSYTQLAESAFDFWDNPDDAKYDTL